MNFVKIRHIQSLLNTNILAIFLILVIVLTIYHNAFECGLVFDDTAAIINNEDVIGKFNISNIFLNDFWGTPMFKEESHGSYRPIVVLTFKLNYLFTGLDPKSYHITNVLLHSLVSLLVYRLCLLFLTHQGSILSALLFSTHPIHVEAVTGVVGRAELMAAIFFISSLKYFIRNLQTRQDISFSCSHIIFVIHVLVGTLCKEQCITVIGVCLIYDLYLYYQKTKLLKRKISVKPFISRIFFLMSLLAVLMIFRLVIMGSKLPVFSNNPASYSEPFTRILTYLYLIPLNFLYLFYPIDLCCDWSMGSIPLISSITDLRNISTVFTFLALLAIFSYTIMSNMNIKYQKHTFLTLMLVSIPFIPSSNLFFPVGFVLADRILYTPSIGFCFGFGLLYDKITELSSKFIQWTSRKTYFEAFLLVYLILFSQRTYLRNFDWKDEYSLFTSGIRVNPNNAKLWNNVGHSIENADTNGTLKELALYYFKRASLIQPDDVGAHMNVARMLIALNRTSEAEEIYAIALEHVPKPVKGKTIHTRVDPKLLSLYTDFAAMLMKNTSQYSQAEQLLKKAITMRKGNFKAHQLLGSLYFKQNKISEALGEFSNAMHSNPVDSDNLYNLGVILIDNGQKSLGIDYLKQAIYYNPNHKHSLWALASVISDTKPDEALIYLNQLILLNFELEKVHFSLAMLYTDKKKFDEAKQHYLDVILINKTHTGALFNLALLMTNELNTPVDAIPHLRAILATNPYHFKSCILLGDLLMTHENNLEEAKNLFMLADKLNPENLQAKHNLCILYAHQGLLKKARDCLKTLMEKNPDDNHIEMNYKIIIDKLSNVKP